MPIQNRDVTAIFRKVADLLETEGENPFRVRAYRGVAGTVSGLSQRVAGLYRDLDIRSMDDLRQTTEKGRLAELKGFGARPRPRFWRRSDDSAVTHRLVKDSEVSFGNQRLPQLYEILCPAVIEAM
jgi:DNA polymerase/3'-5' exonuclease PolX